MLTRRSRTIVRALLAASALAAVPASATAAEVFYATTSANDLVSFTSQAPNRILDTEPIGGLAANETVVGLDQRPATGQLYALTSTGRVLVINPDSGDIKQVTSAPIPLVGSRFGFDFNPTADRIRITSDAELNLRVHPETGAVAATDGPLAYAVGDAGAGTNPTVTGSAYTFSAFGAATPAETTLFDIDATRNALVRQAPPNDGTLVTVGALGFDVTDNVQLDIAGDQTVYAALATEGQDGTRLYSINTTTGAATLAAGSPRIGAEPITSLASVGQTADDAGAPAVAIGNYTTYRRIWLDRGLNFTLSCPEDCISTVTLRLGTTVLGTASVEMERPGTRVARIALTAAGRAATGAATGVRPATITFLTRDAANNKRTQVTTFNSLD